MSVPKVGLPACYLYSANAHENCPDIPRLLGATVILPAFSLATSASSMTASSTSISVNTFYNDVTSPAGVHVSVRVATAYRQTWQDVRTLKTRLGFQPLSSPRRESLENPRGRAAVGSNLGRSF